MSATQGSQEALQGAPPLGPASEKSMAGPTVTRSVEPLGPLSIVIGRWLGTVVITVRGELDVAGSQRLAAVLHDVVDGQGNLDVVLDLGALHRIDPSALDVLAATADRCAERGGRLRLGAPNGVILDAPTMADLGGLVTIPREQETGRPAAAERTELRTRRRTRDASPAGGDIHDHPTKETHHDPPPARNCY